MKQQVQPLLTCGEFSVRDLVRLPELQWKDEGTAIYLEGGRPRLFSECGMMG